jgi:hypothetical protein
MLFSFDTDAKKVTAFNFQYTVGRKKCPVCGQQKGFITDIPRNGRRPWGYCFHCHASGTIAYLEKGDDYGMTKDLVFQGFMCRANQEFINTGSTTAAMNVLGIPFRHSDPIRKFYNGFTGQSPMRILQMLRSKLGIRMGGGGDKEFWSTSGIVLPIQSWPGRINGFFCITDKGSRAINLRKGGGSVIIRCRPTERRKHYSSITEACREGSMYGSLGIDINLTCDPVL